MFLHLPKRTRFYQSLIDFPLLEKGEADYNCLNNTYIIMIMPFDLFGQGKYCYIFENVCLEDGHIRLGDGAIKIFLNTEGTNPDEVSKTLVDFLRYVKQTSDESVSDTADDKIREIHAKMQKIKSNREIGVAYMQTWERERMLRQEGKAEGKAEAILDLLGNYGSIPQKLQSELLLEADLSVLKKWLQLAAKVNSIDEFMEKRM